MYGTFERNVKHNSDSDSAYRILTCTLEFWLFPHDMHAIKQQFTPLAILNTQRV